MRKYLQLLSIVVLLLSSSQVMAQKVRVVTGHVYDPGKEALVGVTVAVKGSTSGGAITDENGRYMILVPNESGTVIVFSSIGFEKKEVAVGDKKVIDVTMTEKSAYLEFHAENPYSWNLFFIREYGAFVGTRRDYSRR